MVGSGASRGLVGSGQVWVWCDLSKKWFVHIWGICEVGLFRDETRRGGGGGGGGETEARNRRGTISDPIQVSQIL